MTKCQHKRRDQQEDQAGKKWQSTGSYLVRDPPHGKREDDRCSGIRGEERRYMTLNLIMGDIKTFAKQKREHGNDDAIEEEVREEAKCDRADDKRRCRAPVKTKWTRLILHLFAQKRMKREAMTVEEGGLNCTLQ